MVILFSVEETQAEDEEDQLANEANEEEWDEGLQLEDELKADDPVDSVQHAVPTTYEAVTEVIGPVLQDSIMDSKLHIPGFEGAETLAVVLSELAHSSGREYIVPLQLRTRKMEVCDRLHDHDKSASNFVKKCESRWGQTLFGRCLGSESSQSRAHIHYRFLSLKLTLF